MNIKDLYETKYKDYYVTKDGEVYSWYGKKPVLCLKTGYKGEGYQFVVIDGKQIYVHRLMAETFLGLDITNSWLQVNHLDGDVTNNALYNLEICSCKENIRHAQRLKTMRKACRGLHISSKSKNEVA